MVKWRRRIMLGLLALAMAAALVYGFWPKPQAVEVAVVSRAPLEETVDNEGMTRVVDRYVISAPVTGFAQRIDLDVGDSVKRDQTLATLEPLRPEALNPRAQAEAEARVSAAQAAVQAAEAQAHSATAEAELAGNDLKRLVELSKSQFVAQDRLDAAQAKALTTAANVRSAGFGVKVARYELQAARTALTYTGQSGSGRDVAVTAPVNGQVLKVGHESEGVVAAGSALIEIGDPHSLEVTVDVLSASAVKIHPGMAVRFERWGGSEPLQGIVRTVEPVAFTKVSALGVEEQRVWVISDFTSAPALWSRLGDGYRVEASFILWHGDNVLQVPTSSLFRTKDGWAVFVVDHDTARQRAVDLGHRSALEAQVLAGLAAGEMVITHPDETITDGVQVMYRH